MPGRRISIIQGEIAIDSDPDICISTLLGSCVACCLWDPVLKVGGMNHMLLAGRNTAAPLEALMGFNELELLINGLLRRGAQRSRLVAKVFGGARMVHGLSDIGMSNGRFTLEYLEREEIPCVGHSLGGTEARHLLFWPARGIARQRILSDTVDPRRVPSDTAASGKGNDVELLR